MNYILPLAFLMLIYNVVLGTEEIKNDEFTSDGSSDDSLHRVRRGLNMLRLGRGLQMLRLGKRGIPMLRLGRSPSESLSNEEFQYILSLMRNSRQVPLPRYGKHLDFQYMLMNALANADQHPDWLGEDESDDEDRFPGFGYDLDSMPERQIRPIPRPGRLRYRRSADAVAPGVNTESSNAAESKQMDEDFSRAIRVAPLARYGKYLEGKTQEANLEANDDEKRTMRMLRLGRGMRMLRLGKRPDDIEQEEGEGEEEEKRALRLLRLGKRPYAMLRLGRGYNEEEKRALRLLRLGKRADGEDVEQGKFSNYGI